jgi:hypothetical protein
MNQGSNELIDRYVYHVGRHLPPERREDVARELRSLIGDRVDDELQPGQSREAVVLRVLREMGPPPEVAARYGYEQRLLIGTSSLPAFFKLAKIVPLAILAISLLSLPLAWRDGFTPSALFEWVVGYFHAALLNLGVLVVVFVVLEQLSRKRAQPKAAFDPEKLSPPPAEVAGRKVRPAALVAQIYISVAVLVLFNFYPNGIGIWTNSELTKFVAIPLSAIGIHVPLWLLNVWLAGNILLKTEVLRQGTWTREFRWTEVGLSMLGLAVFLGAMWSSHLGQFDAGFLASIGLSPSDPQVAALSQASRALTFATGPLVALILWGIGKDVWRLLRTTGTTA